MTSNDLHSLLSSFKGADNERQLQEEWELLAPAFLYGGYLRVGEDYRIYIRTVEFYFHREDNMISDPIVYHRNGRYPDRDRVPYFPLMSLHAHASGFDIAFENEECQYRASGLIRAYEIYDEKRNEFLLLKNGKRTDDRSTFLYDYLNGFSLCGKPDIEWVSELHEIGKITSSKRRNVFCYDEEGNKTNIADERLWSFTRHTDIEPC